MSNKRLFISYSHSDRLFVKRLTGDLARCGESVWVDQRELRIGDSLVRKLREAIDHAEYFLVVISRASVKSEWVQRELDVAMTIEIETGSIKVLPLIAEGVDLPTFLRGKVYADFSCDYASAFNALLAAIGCPVPDLAVMSSIVYEDRDKLFEKLLSRSFEKKDFLPEVEVAVEITGGYFSYLRGDKGAKEGPSIFQPNALLEIIPERVVQRGPVVVALSTWRDPAWYELEGFSANPRGRTVLHVIGPAKDVRTTIEGDLLSIIDSERSGVRGDLKDVLEWWSVPHSAKEVPKIRINQVARKLGRAGK